MGDDSGKPDHSAAQAMLDICASVGATVFDVTWTNNAGQPRRYDEGVTLAELARRLPIELDKATRQQHNLIIRPRGPGITFLQLDDLKAGQLPAVAFVVIETSPGNYQAWLALPGDHDREFCSRVRKGSGADIGASGATRIPGSLNFKPDHAPEKTGRPDYPRVTIKEARPGQMTSAAELEQLGLVAPKEEFAPLSPARFKAANLRTWPSYQIAADGAPLNKAGTGPDLSRADFVWCMTCSTWGFDEKEITERLLEESEHARHPGNGQPYAGRTATRAAAYVEQRRRQKQMRHWG
jgi:RepB DNA-primase from phage plasmid